MLYITGEESTRQIKLRALRLEKYRKDGIRLAAETEIDDICALIEQEKPGVVIDSHSDDALRRYLFFRRQRFSGEECTSRLLAVAKNHEILRLL